MQKTKTGFKSAVCLTAAVLLGATSYGAVIYDNTEVFAGSRTDQGNAEIGDVVNFSGSDRILTDFEFEYFLSPTAGGNEMGQLFLRAMDGPVVDGQALPGTLLFSSAPFALRATADGYDTINVGAINTVVPNSVAWTIGFSGIDGTEDVGLLFYTDADSTAANNPTFFDPVTQGQEHFMIRRQTDGTWDLLNHDGPIDNLGVRFTAVPEPTTWALLLGGLGMIGFLRRRK